jgi:Coenzyme PQQ synthesis protein D (PqqD)
LSLTVNSILVQEAGLSATEVDGRFVVLSLQAASYFDFNKAASEIWDMLSRPRRVDEILQKLSQHHNVDTEVMTRDVMTFLQSLVAQRLVRILTVEDAR